MPTRRLTKKTIKGKEGLHPGSRKADQLTRVNLRIAKLHAQTKVRQDVKHAKLLRPTFFLHSLSSGAPLSLPSLRALISDVYLTRHDARIAELIAERRTGRPKPKELVELEESRRREMAEWETGFEVIDLTHGPSVKLMWSWLENDTPMSDAHLDLLRQVRIPRMPEGAEGITVSRPGHTEKMGLGKDVEGEGEDWTTLGKARAAEVDEVDMA